ncbi:MAG: hypothetical protein ACK4YP_24780 [Myxococcota bacterium]
MGRWKPQKSTKPPAEKGSTNGAPARPALRVVLGTLVHPVLEAMDRPSDGRALATIANMAALAWNLSRLELRADAAALAPLEETAARLRAADPDVAEVFDLLLARARAMDPDDTRLLVKADLAIRRGKLVVEAAGVEG